MIFIEKIVINESCDRLMIKREFLYILILEIMLKVICCECDARRMREKKKLDFD